MAKLENVEVAILMVRMYQYNESRDWSVWFSLQCEGETPAIWYTILRAVWRVTVELQQWRIPIVLFSNS